MFSPQYKEESKKEKREQNQELLKSYQSLEADVKTLDTELTQIEATIKNMVDSPSPFQIHKLKIPGLGTNDTYDMKKLECVPVSDEKTSVREVWKTDTD